MLIEDVLYALLGHVGSTLVTRGKEGRFDLAAGLPLVDASERELLNRLLRIAEAYDALNNFISGLLYEPARGADDPYAVCVAEGLEECTRPYCARVLELEQALLRNPELSLPALQTGLAEYELLLPALVRLVAPIRRGDVRGSALVDHLHEAAVGAVDSVRLCAHQLLWHAQRVLHSQVHAWLIHGELLEGDGDFFVRRRAGPLTEAAASGSATASGSASGAGGGGAAGRSADDWAAHELCVTSKPACVPMRVAERILFVGKAVRVLRSSSQRDDAAGAADAADGGGAPPPPPPAAAAAADAARSPAASSPSPGAPAPASPSAAAAAMSDELQSFAAELRELQAEPTGLQPASLERVVARMHASASRRLWQHIHHEAGLPRLLGALKDHFLLGRGELYSFLLVHLREPMLSPPPPRFDARKALAAAAASAWGGAPASDASGYFPRLALSLPPSAPGTSAYDAWRRLSLSLRIGWPLELLVTPACLKRYDALFGFLLLVKRVQGELHEAWASQTACAAFPAAQRALLLPLWQLRAQMAFVVDNLQYYLQVDVLAVQWDALTRAADDVADFEALVDAHDRCLSALHAQCFLQASSVAAALHQIFQLCLALCRMLSYADAGASAEDAYRAQFATVHREFHRQSAFLFAYLSNMSSPQASPHLAQLLLRLNFNSFFQAASDGDAGAGPSGGVAAGGP